MDGLGTLLIIALLLGLIVGLVVVTLRWVVQIVTIHDYERGLRYRNGRFVGIVSGGTHVVPRWSAEIQVLDARPTWHVLDGQEVPTADGIAVKVSLACHYVVGDVVAAHTGDQDYQRALHIALQLALRDAIVSRTLDEAFAARATIGTEIADRCALEMARIGVELLAVQVRDIIVPAELKRAFAGVIGARKESEAGLERARGETAALRHLANAGRLVEQSPGLLSLRAVQHLGQATGNSLVVTLPDPNRAGDPAGSDGRSAGGPEAPMAPPREAATATTIAPRRRPRNEGTASGHDPVG